MHGADVELGLFPRAERRTKSLLRNGRTEFLRSKSGTPAQIGSPHPLCPL